MMRSIVIDMNDEPLHTLAQMQVFLDGTETIEFSVAVEERYGFIARTVRRLTYAHLKRAYNAWCCLPVPEVRRSPLRTPAGAAGGSAHTGGHPVHLQRRGAVLLLPPA